MTWYVPLYNLQHIHTKLILHICYIFVYIHIQYRQGHDGHYAATHRAIHVWAQRATPADTGILLYLTSALYIISYTRVLRAYFNQYVLYTLVYMYIRALYYYHAYTYLNYTHLSLYACVYVHYRTYGPSLKSSVPAQITTPPPDHSPVPPNSQSH